MSSLSLVLDTSMLVAAALSQEDGHPGAAALMAALDAEGAVILVPALLIPELMGALRRTRYPPARVRQQVRAFRSTHVTILPLDTRLADQAGEIALLHAVKGSDSVFLALARSLAVPLVTLNREQIDRAPADVEVFTPEQTLAKWWPR